MNRPQPKPFRHHLAAALGFVAVAAVVAGGILIGTQPGDNATTEHTVSASPALPGTAAYLMTEHDCWTLTDGPPADMEGELPGHVVVFKPGAAAPTYSARLVGPALEQIAFDHPELGWEPAVDHGLSVRGFCR